MKTIKIMVASFLLLYSCQKQDVTPSNNETTIENCDCDRIVDIKVFYVIGTPEKPEGVYHCPITTINDCNKMQKFREFNYKDKSMIPKVGNCHPMGYQHII